MNRRPPPLLLLLLLALACDGSPAPPGRPALDAGRPGAADASAVVDDGGPTPAADAGPAGGPDAGPAGEAPSGGDAGQAAAPPPDWPDGRGWRWVRTHPMFISGLTVRMGSPPRHAVDRYFDDFGASAIHLWETALPDELEGWLAHRPAPWLTWLHADGTNVVNGRVIGGYPAAAPGRIGYQIGDEPRTDEAMAEILRGLAAVAEADPGALRVVNFSHEPEGLDRFVDRYCDSGLGDVVSYDLYTRANHHYEKLAHIREVGLRCGMPYWRYLKGYQPPGDVVQSESDLRWAAFVGLLYGYTGHSWFLYAIRNGGGSEGIPSTFFSGHDWDARPTERFEVAARLNREMAAYGRALTQLLSTDVAWVTDVSIPGVWPPAGVAPLRRDMDPHLAAVELSGSLTNLALGFFVDRHGDRYLIAMNPNHTNGSFPTEGDDRVRATLRFDFASTVGIDSSHVLLLGPDGRVTERALSGGALSLDLPAGDLVFLKYDTGRPFAGY